MIDKKYKDLQLVETSITWQGEGDDAGKLIFLLRFLRCNIRCPYCFGVVGGRRIPRLSNANGVGKIKITDVKIGDVIYTFDDNQNIVKTTVTNVITRDVTEYYEIKINGIIYYVTPEHPFFTIRGLVEAQNLKIGDKIISLNDTKKVEYIELIKDKLKVYNISCSPYNTYLIDNMWVHNCDTLDRIESCPVKRYTFKQLTDIGEKANHNYVITGGEPTLYNDQILDFIEYLQNNIPHYTVGFETNGFKMIELYNNIIKYIPGAIDHIKFSFSPKFLNTKNTKDLITKICKNIPWDKFIIKMVYEEGKEDELETIVHLIRACNDKIMIFLMPESIIGTETILRMTKLLPLAKKLKCNISSRLHLIHNFY